MAIRDFLYLDRELTRSFLAQLEGGQVDEERSRETRSMKGDAGVSLGVAGVGANVGVGGASERETELVIRQVAASEFERLYNLLDGRGEIRVVDRADNAHDVGNVSRKAFVEFDGRVMAAGFGALADGIARILPVLDLVEKLPSASVEIDKGTLDTMAAFTALAGNQQHTSITITVPGAMGFKVVAELKREHILSAEFDLDATAFVRVQRVLRDDETVVVGDSTGGLLGMVPAEKRQELTRSFRSPEAKQFGLDAEIEVRGPAVVVTPIAIFR